MDKNIFESSVKEKLGFLYGKKAGGDAFSKLQSLLERYRAGIPTEEFDPSERDVVLITYGDGFVAPDTPPLEVLGQFLHRYLKGIVSVVHILPFFPFSSDDGFSVIDYKAVNPELGMWEHVSGIRKDFRLMFDAVINHISKESREFREFKQDTAQYRDFFITVDENTDISQVFRPRALPLISNYETKSGMKSLWTTFSTDQIDLNFKNPDVLLFIIDVLLFYISHGASIIRLDAIAYLWKESGTNCLHLPQTHMVVKLFRDIFDHIAPHVKILTETNVPHKENISYFGNGSDEAHLVYNFALPPLSAHALITGDSKTLSLWARTLHTPGENNFFYNFTASHDGIGMLPAKDLLNAEQIDGLAEVAKARGGRLGYKSAPDGTKTVYELNISLFDLLSDPSSNEPLEKKVGRFIASQAIALSLKGIPAIYYHSLVGSENYYEGVERTGMNRSINREKLDLKSMEEEIQKAKSRRNLVFHRLAHLIEVRRNHPAFHPKGTQKVLDLHQGIFALERVSPDSGESILVLINVTDHRVELDVRDAYTKDLITDRSFSKKISVTPFEVLWLQQYPQNS
jgi:glycosidase